MQKDAKISRFLSFCKTFSPTTDTTASAKKTGNRTPKGEAHYRYPLFYALAPGVLSSAIAVDSG